MREVLLIMDTRLAKLETVGKLLMWRTLFPERCAGPEGHIFWNNTKSKIISAQRPQRKETWLGPMGRSVPSYQAVQRIIKLSAGGKSKDDDVPSMRMDAPAPFFT